MAQIDWAAIERILGSRAAENVMGIAGAGLSAAAGANQNAANQRQSAAQFAAQMQQQQANQRLAQAEGAANASPLGANENFAANQALRHMVLSGLRNPSITASDPGVAAAMPNVTPAFQLPQGGIPQEVLRHLAPEATAGAIAQRQQHISNIDPNAPGVNFARMGFDPGMMAGMQTETDNFRTAAQTRQSEQESRTQQQLQAALAAQQQPEKKSGFLSKLGGALKFAAPIAAMAIPGVGPLAAAAIAGGGTALGGMMQGQGVGNSLAQGAMSGATSAAGARGPARPPTAATPPFNVQNLQRGLRRQYVGG